MNKIFKITPAGAGSGKTYKIKSDLTEWVRNGDVKPHRIMAVTFTEAAAGELKERIRGALLADGLVNAALDVERAYVSTIHGLGLRISTEYAFASGSSPQPRPLSDAERDLLIRRELAHCEPLDEIKADLKRFGYAGKPFNGDTEEDIFRQAVFSTIDLIRSLGPGGLDPKLAKEAVHSMRQLYGNVVSDPKPLRLRLQTAAKCLLAEFPNGGQPYSGDTKAAKDAFRNQYNALRAARQGLELDSDWKIWITLSALRIKAVGVQIPERFVELSKVVISAAEEIKRHPGPLNDACINLSGLILGAQAILEGYAKEKRKAGVIDYADMIIEAEKLVRTRPDVLSAIMADVDCVIVDEFQDTNPVQFALLWRIAQAAPRTLLVGDTKQSIMGFQGAEPRLTDELVSQFSDNVSPLGSNWRSDPRIMHFVNEVGSQLFGKTYHALSPQRPETGNPFLEFISISQGRSSRAPKARPEQHIAARIKAILDDKTIVAERHSDMANPKMRPVSPNDIAVLCHTHAQAGRYADRLQELGIPVRINRMGWLESPPVIAACNALTFVSDPTDAHAALCFLTLGPAAMPLQDAIEALTNGSLFEADHLKPLLEIVDAARSAPLRTIIPLVIAEAGLRDWANTLYNAPQMRADLLRFEGELDNFESAHRDMKAAAGFYGYSTQVFLGWLFAQKDERDFNRHPDPSSGSADGVEIITWHASKGREWNIVVVVGLDTKIAEKPGTMRAQFEDFKDLNNVLNKAQLRYTPNLPIKEKKEEFIEAQRLLAEEDAKRLLYVAMTRARDRLILEWPIFKLKKPTGGNGPGHYAEMLVADCRLKIETNTVVLAEKAYPAILITCSDEQPPEFDKPKLVYQTLMTTFGEARKQLPFKKTSWRIRPSQLATDEVFNEQKYETFDLGMPIEAREDEFLLANERGTAWHLAFRTSIIRPDLIERVCNSNGLSHEVAMKIEAQANAVSTWLKSLNYNRFHFELPVQIRDENGAETNATIDLLAESEDGFMILDHKSDSDKNFIVGFAKHKPQLDAYTNIVAQLFPNKPVHGKAINWMRHGVVTVQFIE